jgi:glycine/D-amino acid oxidase-like deaminating enzyme
MLTERVAPTPPWPHERELRGELPASTDVLIVGGGLAGTALAHHLAGAGVEVVLLERGELNREASGTNAGSFHFQIALHHLTALDVGGVRERLLAEVRGLVEAARTWQELERELGASLDTHVTGGLMVAESAAELQLLREKHAIEREAGLETHVLVGEELRRVAPYLSEHVAGATLCPREGHANPLHVVPLFARRALDRGAVLRTHVAVTGIELPAAGGARRFAVTTSAGRIEAHRVVNASGAWADEVAALAGLPLAVHRRGLHVNVTEPRERLLEPLIQHIGRRLTLKQAANGTFIIGGGWPSRPAPPPERYATVWDSMAGNAAVAVEVVPRLADVRVLRTWSGVMAFTNDFAPIVGPSRRLPGWHTLVVTTGFTLIPLLARRLAEQMTAPGASRALPPEHDPDRG